MSAEDKVKNTAETAKGKAKEGVGTATGNESLKGRGPRRSDQGRPQAGLRENQGRLQEVANAAPGRVPQRGPGQTATAPSAWPPRYTHSVPQGRGAASQRNPMSIGIGTIVLIVIIVLVVLMLRRRSARHPAAATPRRA